MRETVGALSQHLMNKEPETRDPIEIQREVHKKYEEQIYECMERGKKDFPFQDFYIEVITKKERLMPNVLRNYYFPVSACPTPTYDQIIYKYHRADERIEFLWVVPAQDIVEMFVENALEIVEEEKELLNFVLSFTDGSLLNKARLLNGEII